MNALIVTDTDERKVAVVMSQFSGAKMAHTRTPAESTVYFGSMSFDLHGSPEEVTQELFAADGTGPNEVRPVAPVENDG